MGFDHTDDRRVGGCDLGLCSSCTPGCFRPGHGPRGVILNDRGSAVLASLAGITASTLIALSFLALGFSAINVLVIRDAAIEASAQAGLVGAKSKQDYLWRLVRKRVPSMVSVQVVEIENSQTTGYLVESSLPGLGLLGEWLEVSVEVAATKEQIL